MSYIQLYIKHVRSKSNEVKNIHSVLIASVLTGFFIVVYLFLVRDISPPTPNINISSEREYKNNLDKNTQNTNSNLNINQQDLNSNQETENTKTNMKSKNNTEDNNPFQSIKDIFKKASEDFSNIKNGVEGSEYKSGL